MTRFQLETVKEYLDRAAEFLASVEDRAEAAGAQEENPALRYARKSGHYSAAVATAAIHNQTALDYVNALLASEPANEPVRLADPIAEALAPFTRSFPCRGL